MKLRILLFLSVFTTCLLHAQDGYRIELLGMTAQSSGKGWIFVDNSYLAGIDFSFSNILNDKLDANYGVGIRMVNYSEKDYSFTFATDFNGTGVDQFKSWMEINGNFNFIAGNAGLRWKTSDRRKHLYIKPSVEAWYYLGVFGGNTRVQESGFGFLAAGDNSLKSPNRLLIFGNAAIGYQFPIQKLDFFVEAKGSYTFQKFFETLNGEEGVSITPIGIAIGCQF